MSTFVVILFRVQPAKVTAFKSLLGNVKSNLPKVPGCLNVQIFEGTEEGNKAFTLVEEWESQGQHQKHVESLIASGAWSDLKAHLNDEPISGYYTRF